MRGTPEDQQAVLFRLQDALKEVADIVSTYQDEQGRTCTKFKLRERDALAAQRIYLEQRSGCELVVSVQIGDAL